MRLDIPIWYESYEQCVNETCSRITETSYVNILTPDMLFYIGIGSIFTTLTYLVYRHESKKASQKLREVAEN